MNIFTIFIVTLIAVIIGQLIKKNFSSKVFYISHYIGIVFLLSTSIIVSRNQSGGLHWPWWFFAMFFVFPVALSLIIGSLQYVGKPGNRGK